MNPQDFETGLRRLAKFILLFIGVPATILLIFNIVMAALNADTWVARVFWGVIIAVWAISVLLYIEATDR